MTNNRGTTFVKIPIRFRQSLYLIDWAVVNENGVPVFEGSSPKGQSLPGGPFVDGWELVRRFLVINPNDEQSVLKFLVAHGRFKMPSALTKSVDSQKRPFEGSKTRRLGGSSGAIRVVSDRFTSEALTAIQDYLRRMLMTGDPALPTAWAYFRYDYTITFAGTRFRAEAYVKVSDIFPSMLATIQFKLVQGSRFRVCARRDCRLPFEVTSRHKRRFCTQYCAHFTSLRNRRRLQRSRNSRKKSQILNKDVRRFK